MRIVFAASEMVPFAKTGGLADVIGSLAAEIRLLGHEVAVFLPRYKVIDIQNWRLKSVVDRLEIPLGTEKEPGRILTSTLRNGVKLYFVEHPEFYARNGLYGTTLGDFADNDRRFIFFGRAMLEALKILGLKPDMIHCHDWQTGLVPVYLKTIYARDPFYQKIRTVFTIHNLGYQGNFPPDSLPLTGLGWNQFRMERLEFYGKVSFLKAALLDADSVTTVSERYAREIQSKEFGCGMEGILSKRRENLYGVVNGIDLQEWNPETDPDLAASYGIRSVEKKRINKAALQKENNLALDPRLLLCGVVSRLVDQKGIDLLIPALAPALEQGIQFVILGTGEEKYHQWLREIAKKNKGKCSVHILFDPRMAKRIYAGADTLLMPSYYEPCGLGQMIALRFGTIPVVRATGGLADTVQNYDPRTGLGNGFSFQDYASGALVDALGRASEVYRNEKKWRDLVQTAMTCDFSWAASARKYVQIYDVTKRRPIEGAEKRLG